MSLQNVYNPDDDDEVEKLEDMTTTSALICDVSREIHQYNVPDQVDVGWVLRKHNIKLLEQVGRGSYAQVYRATNSQLDMPLACKVIDLTKQNMRQMIEHLRIEVFVMMKCRHSNIINIVDQFLINTQAYIVMEFANGGSLGQPQYRLMSESNCKYYFSQIVAGLLHLHRNCIAHRDLKLENILIVIEKDGKKVVKITDFGLSMNSYKPTRGVVQSGYFAGTRNYMAPECLRYRVYKDFDDGSIDFDPFKADFWSLGVCLYEMLTGKLPYRDLSDEGMIRKQESNYDIGLYGVSIECNDILRQMLTYDPVERIDPFGLLTHAWLSKSRSAQ